jgi:leucyl-tRNA synthetase
MPQWAGSSWYYLRFLDPHNDNFLIDKNIEKEWPQVDVYVGGDHATRHLIYARFWHKFLFDIGVVSKIEPFERLEFLGFILAEDGRKMSKRWGNIINPDDVVAEYGADTLRLYEMFMAPFEATAVWSTKNIVGVKRFLERVEKIKIKSGEPCENQNIIHQTIKKVGEDIENFKFNTAVSQMMICLNEFEKGGLSDDEYQKFMTILAPFAPEIASEFVGKDWPIYDESKIVSNVATLAVQINGKLRGTLETEMDNSDENIIALLKDSETYKKHVTEVSLEPKKIIVVKNKIISIVI